MSQVTKSLEPNSVFHINTVYLLRLQSTIRLYLRLVGTLLSVIHQCHAASWQVSHRHSALVAVTFA